MNRVKPWAASLIIGATIIAVSPTSPAAVAMRRRASVDIIRTIAGSGTAGFAGDGGLAVSAWLKEPGGVTADTAGNVFVSDTANNRIRRIDRSTGIITTIAGTGVFGFSGDGGPATDASMKSPYGIAVDDSGNVFFADQNNFRVRRIDAATGTITTVAGTVFGFSGDGGPASAASLKHPFGVALDREGNLFVADSTDARIRRVDAVTGIITTVAGTGTSGFGGDGGPATAAMLNVPRGIAVDPAGHLYIAEQENFRVRRVDASTGVITTVAGTGANIFSGDGGLAVDAGLKNVLGVAADAQGHVYLSETSARVRRIDAWTGIISTVAGNGFATFAGDGGPATGASISGIPFAVATDASGRLLIADTLNHRIREVSGNDLPVAVAGSDAQVESTGSLTTIVLDGSGSFDPNGDALSFEWRDAGGAVIATTAAANVDRPNGTYQFTLVVNDGATTAADTVIVTVADTLPPVIGISSPADGAVYDLGQIASAAYACSDAGSGVQTCDGPVPAGSPIVTNASGTFTFTVAATDAAGNAGSASVTYEVRPTFEFLGFETPLLPNGSASIKQNQAGRTIPVMFSLRLAGEPTTAAAATIAVYKVLDVATGSVDTTDLTADSGAANDNGSLFRVEDGKYIFNLSTAGFQAPATYRIVVTLSDGGIHAVDFSLR